MAKEMQGLGLQGRKESRKGEGKGPQHRPPPRAKARDYKLAKCPGR